MNSKVFKTKIHQFRLGLKIFLKKKITDVFRNFRSLEGRKYKSIFNLNANTAGTALTSNKCTKLENKNSIKYVDHVSSLKCKEIYTHSMFVSTSTIARSMSGFSSRSSVSFGVKILHGSHLEKSKNDREGMSQIQLSSFEKKKNHN